MAIKWLKQGAASADLAKKEAAAVELRKETQGKLWRFWLKDGEDAALTFVDGDLSAEGFLLPPRYYEHNIKLNGQFGNTFVCPEQTDPSSGHKCPLCEQGDKPSLVALFTIIDHRSYTKDDKTYTNQRRLLVAKAPSFEMLNKLAIKRGGLAGARFDVSRTGDKSANIGSMFDFTEKLEIDVLKKKYMRTYKDKDGKEVTVCDFEPANYEEEIVFKGEDELRKLGFGKSGVAGNVSGFSGGQSSSQGAAGAPANKPVDYSAEL